MLCLLLPARKRPCVLLGTLIQPNLIAGRAVAQSDAYYILGKLVKNAQVFPLSEIKTFFGIVTQRVTTRERFTTIELKNHSRNIGKEPRILIKFHNIQLCSGFNKQVKRDSRTLQIHIFLFESYRIQRQNISEKCTADNE